LEEGKDAYQDMICNDPFTNKTKVLLDELNPVWDEEYEYTRASPEEVLERS